MTAARTAEKLAREMLCAAFENAADDRFCAHAAGNLRDDNDRDRKPAVHQL